MIKVRFSTGITVTYARANRLVREQNGWMLYAKYGEKEEIIAAIQPDAGAIIEFAEPLRVHNTVTDAEELSTQCIKQLRTFSVNKLVQLKRDISFFDSRAKRWTT